MRKLIVILVLLALTVKVEGAVIEGNVYSWELKRVKAVVEINTVPVQRVVAENGTYSFLVPKGNYTIKAYTDDLFCEENVSVEDNGTYRIDLILFPKMTYDENVTNVDFSVNNGDNTLIVISSALIVIALISVGFYIRRKGVDESLPDDLKVVLDVLKAKGGRATQKEIREELGWSEAKLSLVLTDLERRGLIEKYKKGRGNVVFLK